MSETFEVVGIVERILGNNNYEVTAELDGKSLRIICYLSGKMRQFKINVLVGDQVRVVLPPPYDRGRITFREK
jgi:translation initiation factor IF-1